MVIADLMKLNVTPSLNGSLGEAYYKEACDQKGWAYISLENIPNDKGSQFKDGNILVFKKGFHRIRIKIPEQFISEIKELSRPTNNSLDNPSFVFDYLVCRVGQKSSYEGVIIANPSDFCWAEVKTGNSGFSDNQVAAMGKIKLPLALFYIEDVYQLPENIEIEWIRQDSRQWLDEVKRVEKEELENEEEDDNYY